MVDREMTKMVEQIEKKRWKGALQNKKMIVEKVSERPGRHRKLEQIAGQRERGTRKQC